MCARAQTAKCTKYIQKQQYKSDRSTHKLDPATRFDTTLSLSLSIVPYLYMRDFAFHLIRLSHFFFSLCLPVVVVAVYSLLNSVSMSLVLARRVLV